MMCIGHTRTLELAPGDLVRLDDARGTTLRVTRGRLWLTQEQDRADVVLAAGDVFTVERNGATLVEAQRPSALCMTGPGAAPARTRPAMREPAHRLRTLIRRLAAAA
jgi:Protein of unknown function (DUF2917)